MMNVILKTPTQLKKYDDNLKNTYNGLQIHNNIVVDFARLKSDRSKENTCAYIILKNVITNHISIKRFDNYRKICKRKLKQKNQSLYAQSIQINSPSEFAKYWKNKSIAGLKAITAKINYISSVNENWEYVKIPSTRFILFECKNTSFRKWISEDSIKVFEYHLELNPSFKFKIRYRTTY